MKPYRAGLAAVAIVPEVVVCAMAIAYVVPWLLLPIALYLTRGSFRTDDGLEP